MAHLSHGRGWCHAFSLTHGFQPIASAAKIAARLAEADCGATTGPLFHADLGGLIHVEPVERHRLAVLFDARSSLVLVRLRTRKARGKLDEAIGAPNPEQAD